MNCYHPGWRSPPDVLGPDESTGRKKRFLYTVTLLNYNMQSLTKKVYNEVHAQRSLAFFIVDVNFL